MNVVFDFDKTLTRRDTTRPLFFFLARQQGRRPWFYVMAYGLYRLGLWSERRFKSALVRRYVRGLRPQDTAAAAAACLRNLQPAGMNESILTALRGHLAAGDRVFVASANFDFLIAAFCAAEGVGDHFATGLAVTDGRYTGELSGTILKGAAKLAALEKAFGADGLQTLKFYGDAEDRILLQRIPNHVKV